MRCHFWAWAKGQALPLRGSPAPVTALAALELDGAGRHGAQRSRLG